MGLPPSVRDVVVLGASRSGLAAAAALAKLGVRVTLSDRRRAEDLSGLGTLDGTAVAFLPEDSLGEVLRSAELVVKSPGIPDTTAPVLLARQLEVPVWSEIELAYALYPNIFCAITGTNGKTTTTALLGHIFAQACRPARVLGNIGTAVTSVGDELSGDEELVVEVSSFQLEDVHDFRPAVAVFLNLTPDHLDRHGSMERYFECKAKLFANQGEGDTAVLSLDDAAVARLGGELRAKVGGPRVAFFSTSLTGKADEGESPIGERPDSWVEGGWIFLEGVPALPVSQIMIPGLHNLENCLAAGTAALARGLTMEQVAHGLRTFSGVEHRLETAGIVDGVTYVNDSKATNVEATLTALKAYPHNTHLILGGRDKASDYRPVARACGESCRAVYLIGEATSLIETAFAEVASEGIAVPRPQYYGDLERAVQAAHSVAVPGDVVLLAPACASFDQYPNFERRGEHFRELVHGLQQETR